MTHREAPPNPVLENRPSAADEPASRSEQKTQPMPAQPRRAEIAKTKPSAVYRDPSSGDVEPEPSRLLGRDWLILLIALASLSAVLWNLQDASVENANTGSRYATVESLVDYGSYAIDQSIYSRTIDKVRLGDEFYSSKPPLLPTYAAGLYWIQQQLTGKTLLHSEGDVVRFVSLMTGWLAHLFFLVYLYRLAKLLLHRELAIIGLVALGAFAYLGTGYATTLNNHSISAAIGLVGFYYAARVRHAADPKTRDWLLCGLCLGFLPGFDLPCTLISAVTFFYLLGFDRRKTLTWFLPALAPGLFVHLLLTYQVTGSILPVYLRRDLYDYPGSYWHREQGIDALREPKHIYAFNVLFGHHGLFSMTPVFLFSAYELYRTLRQKLELRAEAWLTIAISGGLSLFYIFYSHNYGGWCVGMRWLIPAMPLLLLFSAVWLDRVELGRLAKSAFAAAFLVSSFHVQDALDGPFQFSVWHNWLDHKPNRGRTGKQFNLKDHARKGVPSRAR